MNDISNDENFVIVSKYASGIVLVGTIAFIVWKYWRKPKLNEYPRDTVILHQLRRGPYAPSISQFVLKLETYLKMAKIPYINVHGLAKSSKGKYPWIEYNGQSIADTEFIIEFLNETFGVNLDAQYSARDCGIARAFQKMLEENTFWTVTLDRWLYDQRCSGMRLIGLPSLKIFLFQRHVRQTAHAQGIGRHSQEEVYHILDQDLQSLSDFMGTNKFLLGDEPCQADSAVFGQLAQIYWHSFGNKCHEYIKKHQNLCDYCERMKQTFWPDWDQCITKGMTQKATK